MILEFYRLCVVCLLDGITLAYAVLVFGVSFAASRRPVLSSIPSAVDPMRYPPIPGGELPFPPHRNPPKSSKAADLFSYAVDLASFDRFRCVMRWTTRVIRTIFLLRDNPRPMRSFLRYLNVYYLVILLPAAFMPPVLQPQRSPDFHLLAAVVFLICINAAGDVLSVRLVLRIFEWAEEFTSTKVVERASWRQELAYYLAIIGGGFSSIAVLVAVLACSSVLYGVQVGEIDFGLSEDFFVKAIDRMGRFYELAWSPYWFRGQPGPFGWAGIPGLFIYGSTTFFPTIILTLVAVFWLLLLPFRIAVNLPPSTPPVLRVISAEAAVFSMCLVVTSVLGKYVHLKFL
jgi:hypothetical protein